MASWFAGLLGVIQRAGTDLALGKGLNFTGGLTAALNSVTTAIDVSVESGAVGVDLVAAEAGADPDDQDGVPVLIHRYCAGAAAGSSDDVSITRAYGYRICDVWFTVDDGTDVTGSTVILRSAAGGAGAELSGSMNTAFDGTKRSSYDLDTPTVAANVAIFLRRSDRDVAGHLFILALKT